MAAMTSPSTSQAERKSFAITSMFFLPARGTLGSASSRRLLIRRRALQVDAKETAPPVLEAGPAPAMTVDIVAGAHVGIRGAQMSVEHRRRKTRRAVVHVDVGATAVRRNRDLNRRRTALRAIVGRVALVKDGVVDTALELLRPRQRVQRGGDQADVDAELAIAGRPGDLAADRLHVLDQRERIRQPRQLRACRVGERRRHQGVRDGVERRLRGDGENLVVKGRGLQLLARRVLEARQPVVDQALAAFAKPSVCAAELQWLLLREAGFDRRRAPAGSRRSTPRVADAACGARTGFGLLGSRGLALGIAR